MNSKRELSDRTKQLRTVLDEAAERNPRLKLEQRRARAAYAFANELRRVREEKGLTQEKLAERMDVSQSFVARLENPQSDKRPALDTMAKAASALGFDVSIQFVPERSDQQTAENRHAISHAGNQTSISLDEALEVVRQEMLTRRAKEKGLWETYFNRTLINLFEDESANVESFLTNQICEHLKVGPSIRQKRANMRAKLVKESIMHGRKRIFCGVLNESDMLQIPMGVKLEQQESALYTILGGEFNKQSSKK